MIETRFKDTEIGKIPEEWEVVKLSAVASNFTGLTYHPEDVSDHGTLVLRSSNIQNGFLSLDDKVYVNMYIPDRAKVQEHDILICVRNGSSKLIGKSTILDKRCVGAAFGAFMTILRVYKDFDYKYVSFAWQSDYVYNQIHGNSSATINQITNKDINACLIALPSLSEQRRIATALSNVDALIAAVEKKIEKKKLIKQGAMQQLLTGKKRLPGYEGEWVEKRLGEVGKLDRNSINPKLEPNKIFYEYSMPAYDIGRQPIKCLGDTMNSNRFIVKGEMLLFNKLNVRQKRIWLIDPHNDNSVCSQEFLPFTSTKVCLEYIAQLVATDWVTDAFIEKSKGTSNSQKRISPNDFLDYEISIPSDPSEQRAIASILSNMDSEITALERKRDKLKELKQGMMQQLLTGKIRLVRCSG